MLHITCEYTITIITHQPRHISHDTSATTQQPRHQPRHQPWHISHDTSATTHQPRHISQDTSATTHQPRYQPRYQPQCISHDTPSATTHQLCHISHYTSATTHSSDNDYGLLYNSLVYTTKTKVCICTTDVSQLSCVYIVIAFLLCR